MVIISNKAGQLANRLFLFAHFIAFAIENNMSIMNPSFDEYADLFEFSSKDLLCRYPPQKFFINNAKLIRCFIFRLCNKAFSVSLKHNIRNRFLTTVLLKSSKEAFDLDNPANITFLKFPHLAMVGGWLFRCPLAFRKHSNRIRALFNPRPPFLRNVDNLMAKIRASSDIVIGIHIRRGDYKNFENGNYFFDLKEYLGTMHQLEEIFNKTKVGFLIQSNERLDSSLYDKPSYYFGTQNIIEDLYAFSKCDYLFGPPSTYSMWASFCGKVPLYVIKDMNSKIDLQYLKFVDC